MSNNPTKPKLVVMPKRPARKIDAVWIGEPAVAPRPMNGETKVAPAVSPVLNAPAQRSVAAALHKKQLTVCKPVE